MDDLLPSTPVDPPDDVLIRHAELDDAVHLLELWAELDRQHRHEVPELLGTPTGPAPALDFLDETLHDRERTILVAESDTGLVGLVHVFITDAPEHPLLTSRRFMVIHDLVVHEARRGQGIGEALVETAEEWAKAKGVHQFEAEVYDFNETARTFYDALGYSVVSHIVGKFE